MNWWVRMFFKLVRLVLTPIVLLVNWLTQPKGIERPLERQRQVDAETRSLVLYHYYTCPFCMKVRREMRRLSLPIETRDAQHEAEHREALIAGGGKNQVPCLRITGASGAVSWVYESDAIIAYLRQRFAAG